MEDHAGDLEAVAGAPVVAVADDGVAEAGQVDPDLVRAARLQLAVEERADDGLPVAVADLVAGAGLLAAGHDRHAGGVAR